MKQISKLYMDFGFRIQDPDPDPDPGLGLDWKFGVQNLDLKFQIWIWVRILEIRILDFGFWISEMDKKADGVIWLPFLYFLR